jgi:hypothetical protein
MRPSASVVLLAVGLLVGTSPSSGAAPAPETPDPPFRLHIGLDRETYFEREGIFLEWRLTCTSDRPISLPVGRRSLRLECTDAAGKEVPLYYAGIKACYFGKPRLFTLNYRESSQHWLDVRRDYMGLVGVGEFTLRLTYTSAYWVEGQEEFRPFTTCSQPVKFRVVRATGEDARALELINQRMRERIPEWELPEGTSPERRHLAALECENLCDGWCVDQNLCIAILDETRSARFGALAAYSLGMVHHGGWCGPNETSSAAAVRQFLRCLALTDSWVLKRAVLLELVPHLAIPDLFL